MQPTCQKACLPLCQSCKQIYEWSILARSCSVTACHAISSCTQTDLILCLGLLFKRWCNAPESADPEWPGCDGQEALSCYNPHVQTHASPPSSLSIRMCGRKAAVNFKHIYATLLFFLLPPRASLGGRFAACLCTCLRMFSVRCLADKRCLVDTGELSWPRWDRALKKRMDSHPLHNIWKAPLEAAASTPFLRLSRTSPGPHTLALKALLVIETYDANRNTSTHTYPFIDYLSPFFPLFHPFCLRWRLRKLASRPRLLKCVPSTLSWAEVALSDWAGCAKSQRLGT